MKPLVIGVAEDDPRNRVIFKFFEDNDLDVDVVEPPVFETNKIGKRALAQYKEYVIQHIAKVKPKFVLLVGDIARKCFKDEKGLTLKKLRGRPFEIDGVAYLPTISGAYADYDPRQLTFLLSDLRLFDTICKGGGIPKEDGLKLRPVFDWDDFDDFIKDLSRGGVVSYDIETTGLYPWAFDAQIWSIGFGTGRYQWVIPLIHRDPRVKWTLQDVSSIFERIDKCLTKAEPTLVMHNGKFDSLYTRVQYGYEWEVDFDTMLAHYILDENDRHDLKYLAKVFFGAPDYDVPIESKTGGVDLDEALEYHGLDLYYTRKLFFPLSRELKAEPAVSKVFYKILMPCARLFTEIEERGVYIDIDQFDEAETYLRGELKAAGERLKKYGDINWGSTKQLGDLLFNKLKIKPTQKTKTGGNSTSESALKMMNHPLVTDLLKYRGAKQQLSFFIEGWKPFLTKENRLHPSFKLHGTVTGRLSCENPNLQQVPRDPRIRSLITAPKGWTLIEADLSQIELRIVAELSQDPTMVHAFMNGIDLHWLTAIKEISRGGGLAKDVLDTASILVQRKVTNYGEAIEILLKAGPEAAAEASPVWKELRKKAKAINFGYVYGMWWKKFKQYARDNYDVILSDKEAEESRRGFFETYSALSDWHNRQRKFAQRNGYVRSLAGRKRRLPAAMDYEDTPERAEALRQAINAPVQSFGNELNLMAALQLRQEFPRRVLYIVGTVHDALLMECRNDYVERVARRTLEVMSHPKLLDELGIELSIPLDADVKLGPWSKGVGIDKWLKAA